ncbi:cell division protein FtsX [Sphingomonas arenae]|uniref:cell division protein FtsX n=2 Tax=Sphingomonas arenae TaxID=2812555 RepID=UPI001966DC7B|nr:hypothetical protein [Sphingomonas arenae]
MLSWMFPPVPERRLLPDTRGRPMPWVIGIMMFVTVVVAAAGLAIANSASVVRGGVENRYSIQIPDGGELAATAASAARSAPGVTAVRPVPEADVRKTLKSWLGDAASNADLPLPSLIDIDLAAGADPAAVEQRVRSTVPQARFTAYKEQLAPLARSLTALQWLALGLVVLMAVATAASVVLAARSALEANRTSIEIMHGVGATDEQVARLFQRRIAIDAFIGGAAGAGLAALTLLLVAGVSGNIMGDLVGGSLIGPGGMLLLALLPLAFTLLATVVARAAVLKALRAAL